MRRRVRPVEFTGEEPPQELLRFASRASSPAWAAEDFAAWLRARAAWRDAHAAVPLPGLPARERIALRQLDLPTALVEAEVRAPKAPPDWRRWQLERGITDPRQVLSKTYNDEFDRGIRHG